MDEDVKDSDDERNETTKIGAGIKIDLFLKREFGNLMTEPQKDRVDTWIFCRHFIDDLLTEYEIRI